MYVNDDLIPSPRHTGIFPDPVLIPTISIPERYAIYSFHLTLCWQLLPPVECVCRWLFYCFIRLVGVSIVFIIIIIVHPHHRILRIPYTLTFHHTSWENVAATNHIMIRKWNYYIKFSMSTWWFLYTFICTCQWRLCKCLTHHNSLFLPRISPLLFVM